MGNVVCALLLMQGLLSQPSCLLGAVTLTEILFMLTVLMLNCPQAFLHHTPILLHGSDSIYVKEEICKTN